MNQIYTSNDVMKLKQYYRMNDEQNKLDANLYVV